MPTAGKVEICLTKPVEDAMDLALAYSPGVAEPCLEIARDPSLAYDYTLKGNLVAVISNGTAVLGLGNIGALAGKPVMEGKGVLFKKFAHINSFDLEVDLQDVDKMVEFIKAVSPTFGGINLEDIKAPECFDIETKAQEICDIPIFHDDQHGTAIISAAGILNGCEITGKKMKYEYVDKNREGDHICYLSDLRKIKAHYPGWDISVPLPGIFSEIAEGWRKRGLK